jgi:hypothetical protein
MATLKIKARRNGISVWCEAKERASTRFNAYQQQVPRRRKRLAPFLCQRKRDDA